MKKFIVCFRASGIPPVGISCERYIRGEKYTQFYDEHGVEVAWFNTPELGGMWVVNDSQVIGSQQSAAFLNRKN